MGASATTALVISTGPRLLLSPRMSSRDAVFPPRVRTVLTIPGGPAKARFEVTCSALSGCALVAGVVPLAIKRIERTYP